MTWKNSMRIFVKNSFFFLPTHLEKRQMQDCSKGLSLNRDTLICWGLETCSITFSWQNYQQYSIFAGPVSETKLRWCWMWISRIKCLPSSIQKFRLAHARFYCSQDLTQQDSACHKSFRYWWVLCYSGTSLKCVAIKRPRTIACL